MNLETIGLYLLISGALLGIIGWIWLIARAFGQALWWGLLVLFFPPTAFLFVPTHWARARRPVSVLVLAAVVVTVPYAVNYLFERFADLGPREKMVNGELHITLTGWDGSDYSILLSKPNTVVLQIANADVNDQTLELLKSMPQLRELDLNGTGITDEGLAVLSTLPSLQELRIARTKITDDGFTKHLAAKEGLTKLDLTGTTIKGKTKRDWKKAKEGRDYLD